MITEQDVVPPPDEALSEATHKIADILSRAVQLGHTLASDGEQRGGIGDFLSGLASRAVQIVQGIVSNLIEKVTALFGKGGDSSDGKALSEVISGSVTDWAEGYAETIGITEVTASIEETILDDWRKQGVTKIIWVISPGACTICENNAKAGPIAPGTKFPSGDIFPPAHPRCRCHLQEYAYAARR